MGDTFGLTTTGEALVYTGEAGGEGNPRLVVDVLFGSEERLVVECEAG